MIKKQTRRRPTGRFSDARFRGPRICRLCADKITEFDYKNTEMLYRYISERGKILPSRISGNCARHQRQISRAVKQARAIALLPFVGE